MSAVNINCKRVQIGRPLGKFTIPNLRTRGLIPSRIIIESDPTAFSKIKEFQFKIGSFIAFKGLDSAYLNQNNILDLTTYRSQLINNNAQQELIISLINAKPDKNGNPAPGIYLDISVEYCETSGEPRHSTRITKIDELQRYICALENPYLIVFKPHSAMPSGFKLKPRMQVEDVDGAGYDILDYNEIQSVDPTGSVRWDFGFVTDPVIRTMFCQFTDFEPTCKGSIFPCDVVVYSAPE